VLVATTAALASAVPASAVPSSAAPAPALSPRACPSGAKGRFACGVLPVPLDHAGVVPGGLGLRVMAQKPRTEAQRHALLVVLSGGPGQSGADDGAYALRQAGSPKGYRVVTLDQRGTGRGALVCPALSRVSAQAMRNGTCAGQLGARRRFFTTRDTVSDLELLRRSLGADRMVVQGTSYGTFVAQQYARLHPTTTAGLILDSPVPAAGVEPFGVSSFVAVRTALQNQCGGGRCRGITRDVVGDLRRAASRLAGRTRKVRVFSATGRRFTVRLRGRGPVLGLLAESDLNPYLRGALPAALHRAAAGDLLPLARLVGTQRGARDEPQSALSFALNVTTNCLDAPLPYRLSAPVPDREAQTAAALAAVPASALAPFTRRDAGRGSLADACTGWPADVVAPAATEPLPAVPTLILSGEDDVRTPLADARILAAQIPGARLLRFPGIGHAVLGFDQSGCARRAVRRLLAGSQIRSGSCGGRDNRIGSELPPPTRLAAVRGIGGVGRGPGRIVNAVLRTMYEAGYHDELRRYAGAGTRGGGLHGGSYRSTSRAIELRRYALVPGVRVSGRFSYRRNGLAGRMRVAGPGRLDGTLRITPSRIRGTIGGERLTLVSGG
jgi:pimeloyl-ACP methyl ester carboxylesterase